MGIGTVDTILEIVKENELSNPSIIVLGEVVNHRQIISDIQLQYSVEENSVLYGS